MTSSKMTFFNIFSKKKIKEKEKITIDYREKNSLVASELVRLGFTIEFKQLPVADYLVKDIGIERKTIFDFKSSIINKRIVQQLLELKQFPRPVLILEGLDSEDIYKGGIHENAFRGFLWSVITEFQIPIIFTMNEKDTAKYIAVLASKKEKTHTAIRASKMLLSDEERVQFILEGFPNIGPATAKIIIGHFKTLKNIANASLEELRKVIGKKADKLHQLLNYLT